MSGYGFIGTVMWIGAMYFLFFSGSDDEEKEKGVLGFLYESKKSEPVVDTSYETCAEELAAKHYDNETITQLCSIRERNG